MNFKHTNFNQYSNITYTINWSTDLVSKAQPKENLNDFKEARQVIMAIKNKIRSS